MEIEFRKDFISGLATVKLSMGHEAFATWLEQEGLSAVWVDNLLSNTISLQSRTINEFKLGGDEFTLLLNQNEAQVVNHSLLNDQDESFLEEDMNYYDLEVQAACGLEDFINLIESWLEFIS